MKLTKYEHACLVLEKQGKKLVIDPGGMTSSFGSADDIAAVVVTHVHPDHFDPGHLRKIIDSNPDVPIFTTEEVAEKFQKPNVSVMRSGDEFSAGPFSLKFSGQWHAVIHPDWPYPHNIGLLVNNELYYGGDSLELPSATVETLAVPANAPWQKVSETMDFVAKIKPKRCFPTHNALLSDNGQATYNKWLNEICQKEGIEFKYIKPKESVEL